MVFCVLNNINIINSSVDILNSEVSNSNSEDAINIISSNTNIKSFKISDTYADGLDIDFGILVFDNIECERINTENWVFLKKYFSFKKTHLNFFILSSLPLIKIKRKLFIPFISLCDEDYDFYFKPTIPISRKNYF